MQVSVHSYNSLRYDFSRHACATASSWQSCAVKASITHGVVSVQFRWPRARMRSKGLCDRSWCLYIVCCILYIYISGLFFGTNLLSPKIRTLYYITEPHHPNCVIWQSWQAIATSCGCSSSTKYVLSIATCVSKHS